MSDISITIHNVSCINAGMVATLAAFGNGEQVCTANLAEALNCGLESFDELDDLIVEAQKYPRLEAALERFQQLDK